MLFCRHCFSYDSYCFLSMANLSSLNSDLWPLASARTFPSTQLPLNGHCLLWEPSPVWCGENQQFGNHSDLQPDWHQQLCSAHSKSGCSASTRRLKYTDFNQGIGWLAVYANTHMYTHALKRSKHDFSPPSSCKGFKRAKYAMKTLT